jgi:hypothetical protein
VSDDIKPKLKIFSRFTRNPQWGVGFIFEKTGLKRVIDKKWFKIGTLLLFLVAVTLSFFKKEEEIKIYKNSVILPENLKTDKPSRFTDIANMTSNMVASENKAVSSKELKQRRLRFSQSLGPQIVGPQNSVVVPVGTYANAILVTGASNGPIKARLTQSITINGETLVDEGSILFGQGISTDERLFITFKKIISSDGSMITILGHAYESSDQIVGLKGSKVGDKALAVAGTIGLGFVGGMSEGLENAQTVNGVEIRDNSLRNAMLNGAAHASLDESKELLNDLRTKKIIIEVPAQTAFTVLFEEVPNDREK